MSLAAGSKLGPYEILGLVGAGGMGEVYRARDPRLGREVAIKVLPASFSADPDRLRRFEQEARAAGVLNHPGITAVYDIGQHDGAPYVVQELLVGETLREALASGALPQRTTIDQASQIGEGLAAAHAKGIVHRDLKPENLFVTQEGRIKILDFGLAKLTQRDGPELDTGLPTAAKGTEPGVVMGTLGYMSPEQVRGRPTDARSDIFALGAVLYEMLSGRRAFQGDSAADTMSAILKEDPPDLSVTNRSISPGLERIVRHCLEKNPEQRFQSARDLVFHLQSISADTGSAALAALPPLTPKRRRVGASLAGAGVALLLAAAAVLLFRPPRRPPPPVSRFSMMAPEGVSLAYLGTQSLPVISPDGRQIAFAATDSSGKSGIWVRSLSDVEPRRIIEATDIGGQIEWSPDSRQLAYFARSGNLLLKKVPASGGPATVITTAGLRGVGVGVTWGGDGTILFGVWAPDGGIFRVPEVGGTAAPVVKLDATRGELLVASPTFLPDGRHFLYVVRNRDPQVGGIHIRALDGKEGRRLTDAESQAQYVEPGYLLFMRQRTLFAQRFDAGALALEGGPVTLAQGVWSTPQSWRGGFSAVRDLLVYFQVPPSRSKLLWYDRAGAVLGEVPAPDGAVSPELSPSADRVLVNRRDPGTGSGDIWILEPGRGTATRFTFDPGDDVNGIWSPDGASVYFFSNRSGRPGAIFRKPSSGGQPEEKLSDSAGFPSSLTPDGSTLVVSEALNLWLVPLAGGRPVPLIEAPAYSLAAGQISPDGRFIAYMSDETGQHEIYVQAFPPPGGKWQISNKGGLRPRWRPDGRELFYIAPDRKLMAVAIETASGFRASAPRALFQTRISGPLTAGLRVNYAVARDGRFLIVTDPESGGGDSFIAVQNWLSGTGLQN